MILDKSARYNLESSQRDRACNNDLQATFHTQWISKFVPYLRAKFLMPSSNASSSLLNGKLRKNAIECQGLTLHSAEMLPL